MTATFEQLALHQRACRRFDPSGAVPDADIEKILTIAVHAPSAENSQPWEFVVVRSPDTRHAFAAINAARWRNGGAALIQRAVTPATFEDMQDGIAQGGLESAPVVIVVCLASDRIDEQWGASSIYPATQNLLLAAASLGYGTCLTTGLTQRSRDQVRGLLRLPAAIQPIAGVFLGRPARKLGPPKRQPAREHSHREFFGQPW